ncbi:hypothetical protein SAMN05428989_0747 [Pseudoxanthomonas sp. GM95]|uniref:hypothetical protein n=1 Tax=Pseudoxanthomonas sp. GM95 TaxID=1881043 RepID=UPI0008AFD414|nr:hypothetical protein [Pseudoxanthomonas sp. GM95]SEK75965.1 hypothetical protein SAMN05428989_0747 [Pseudoxanthomonas sp. GM95]
MKACLVSAAGLLLSLAAPLCAAQSVSGCPTLPTGTDLHWEQSGTSSLVICKAFDAQGTQAFGVMLTSKEPDKPSGAREEKGKIDGHKVRWYRSSIANRPDAKTRMAVVDLDDDRYAQIWIDAPSDAALEATIAVTSSLQFDANRPVADNRSAN